MAQQQQQQHLPQHRRVFVNPRFVGGAIPPPPVNPAAAAGMGLGMPGAGPMGTWMQPPAQVCLFYYYYYYYYYRCLVKIKFSFDFACLFVF
jgi:hypothetical protein